MSGKRLSRRRMPTGLRPPPLLRLIPRPAPVRHTDFVQSHSLRQGRLKRPRSGDGTGPDDSAAARLTLRLSACQLLDLALGGAAGVGARRLGDGLLARRAFYLLALDLVCDTLGICHVVRVPLRSWIRRPRLAARSGCVETAGLRCCPWRLTPFPVGRTFRPAFSSRTYEIVP